VPKYIHAVALLKELRASLDKAIQENKRWIAIADDELTR